MNEEIQKQMIDKLEEIYNLILKEEKESKGNLDKIEIKLNQLITDITLM